MKTYSVTIAGGATATLHIGGSFIAVRSTTVELEVRTDTRSDPNNVLTGDVLRWGEDAAFHSVFIRNPSGGAVTVSVAIGFGQHVPAQVASPMPVSQSGSWDVGQRAGTDFVVHEDTDGFDSLPDDSIAATTAELVLAADATRVEAIIKNLRANPADIRVGDSGAGPANGIPLIPGESVTLKTKGAIYVYNTHSVAQSVALAVVKTS